jgi:hypothetical protein
MPSGRLYIVNWISRIVLERVSVWYTPAAVQALEELWRLGVHVTGG